MSPALPLPKYHRIYLVLKEQLVEGRFADGLPGEVALAAQFAVARVTVRRALAQLVAEGLIERARGRGTVPTPPAASLVAAPAAGRGPQLAGLLGHIVDVGLATRVRVLECRLLPAPAAVARALQLPPGTPVQKAVRVRSTREGPLSLITTHVPGALAAGIGRRELLAKPMLILLEEAGVRIGDATQTVSACLADAQAAGHLDVPVGSALLAVTRVIHDAAGRPVQWLHGLYRPDRYQYRMQLSRVGRVAAQVWVSEDLHAQLH